MLSTKNSIFSSCLTLIFVLLYSPTTFAQDYKHVQTIAGHTIGIVYSVAFSPDGATLASGIGARNRG